MLRQRGDGHFPIRSGCSLTAVLRLFSGVHFLFFCSDLNSYSAQSKINIFSLTTSRSVGICFRDKWIIGPKTMRLERERKWMCSEILSNGKRSREGHCSSSF